MKKVCLCILALMLLPVCALGDGPVLLMEMPEDVQMVEDVAFDDGDFIQTYQLGGTSVHLLRYTAFDMTLEELVQSEWTDARDISALALSSVGSCTASGVRLSAGGEGAELVDVTIIVADYGEGKLVFEAVVPKTDAQGAAAVQKMIDTMDVLTDGVKSLEDEVG
ncbi:MAG: hypothetical protein IJD60_09540 [Clostridia bacterium]|nr:hypothetical protein [Clostridia bacterium]